MTTYWEDQSQIVAETIISNKLDINATMLGSEAQCIEEAENCNSIAGDNITDLECRLADRENKLAALTNKMKIQALCAKQKPEYEGTRMFFSSGHSAKGPAAT